LHFAHQRALSQTTVRIISFAYLAPQKSGLKVSPPSRQVDHPEIVVAARDACGCPLQEMFLFLPLGRWHMVVIGASFREPQISPDVSAKSFSPPRSPARHARARA
jgi:hypothetical protein